MEGFEVRRFCDSDADEVAAMIAYTMRTVSIKDYSHEYIENCLQAFGADNLISRAKAMNFYVVTDQNCGQIVGCGAVAPYGDGTDECCYYNIFVLPQFQGRGVGRLIVKTLERDELCLRSKRIEVPSSITACEFYKRLGYSHKGEVVLDENLLYKMEKYR